MLKRAERPIHSERVTARTVRLVRGNVYEMSFEPASFDFIYSLGVFGYGAELTSALCTKLHAWLAPGGRLYVNAIEVPPMTRAERLRKAVRAAVYPWCPDGIQRRIDARPSGVPVIRHTRDHVERVMEAAGFSDFVLSSNFCHSPLWKGTHLECSARKNPQPVTPTDRRVEREFAAA
jgi:ubiquinone/menaquinone biosynthesis C-methylase UbiE